MSRAKRRISMVDLRSRPLLVWSWLILVAVVITPRIGRAQPVSALEDERAEDAEGYSEGEPDEPTQSAATTQEERVATPPSAAQPSVAAQQGIPADVTHPTTPGSDLTPPGLLPVATETADVLDVPAARPPERSFELTAAPGSGVTFSYGRLFSLNLRARMQIRYQLDVPNEDDHGDRELRQVVNVGTARLWISGHAFRPELTFMLQLALADRDFRDGARSPIYDAYVDWRAHRDFNLRLGQFFVPFDRLRTIREWAIQLADRSALIWELTLDRDVGLMLYSDRFLGDRSPVAWRLGVFGGGGINLSNGKPPGALVLGRVELRPLGEIDDDIDGDLTRRPRPAIAIGGAVAANFNTDRVRSTTGPRFAGGTTDFLHAAADLVFKWRGFALQAEYLYKRASADVIFSRDVDGNLRSEPTRSAHGWIVQTSYVFDPPLELVARVARTLPFAGTDPTFIENMARRGQELALGVNYYFNGHKMKLQADWVARMPPPFDFDAADHVVHLQLDATF